MSSAPFGFPALFTGRRVPDDVAMPDGLPVSGGPGSPLVDAYLALQGRRIKDAVTAPSRAWSGDLQVWDPATGHTTDAAQEAASGIAGLAMTGSVAAPVPKGALRSFGGHAAADDPLAALEAALADLKPAVVDPTPRSFVDPAAKSWDLYHGTASPVDFGRFSTSLPDNLRPNTTGSTSQAGAVFFSPAADEAAHYALGRGATGEGAEAGPRTMRVTVDPGKTDMFDLPHLIEHDPGFRDKVWETSFGDYEKRLGPQSPESRQQLRTAFDRQTQSILDDIARTRAFNEEHGHLGVRQTPEVNYFYGGADAAIRRAQEQGLDTAVIRGLSESNGGDQVVALTPGRVRSFYAPDQLLYGLGLPAAGVAGAAALAAPDAADAAPLSPDPKGQPVSSGPIPFGFPALLRPGVRLSPDVMMPDELAGLPGLAGAVPAAPLPQAPAEMPRLPDASPSGAPAPMPILPSPTAPEAAPARMPSLVGDPSFGFPQMPPKASPADLPAPGAVPAIGPAPAGAAAPAQSTAPQSSAPKAAEPSFGDTLSSGLKTFRDKGGFDLLGNIGIGLMSTRGIGPGVAAGLTLAQDQETKRAATDLAKLKGQMEVAKYQREQRKLTGNAQYARKYFARHGQDISDEQAMTIGSSADAMNAIFKNELPSSDVFTQYTDASGNRWNRNTKTGQESVALQADKDRDEGAKIISQIEARRKAAPGLGLVEGTPEYRSFVGTGKIGREQDLTATDRKAINGAEDELPSLDNTLDTLTRARELNRKTFTGFGAGARGWIGDALPDWVVPDMLADKKTAGDTREFGQLMSMEAIKSMSQTLKGATTDREMARFMEILGDPSTSPDIREKTIDRMIVLARRQREIAEARITEMRDGTYYKRGGGAVPSQQPPAQAGAPASAAPTPPRGGPDLRFQQLRRSGLTKEQAYQQMHDEGF